MKKEPVFHVEHLNLFYGEKHALKDIGMDIEQNKITALIGPSGCGKSTFLRCLNRMNDLIEGCRIDGTIELNGGGCLWLRNECCGFAHAGGDGVSKAESVSDVNL